MSKEAYYFSHDANARHDPKILAMRSEFGIQGYGIYWIIIEMLREQEDYKLPMKEYIFNAIAMQVQCKDYAKDDAKQFIHFCINEAELFAHDATHFWSNSLLKRMDKRNELSEKRAAAAKARWDKTSNTNDLPKGDDANAMQMDANAMQTDARKGKEIKEKEIKENKKDNTLTAFSEFWDAYPRKLDKKKALEKFKTACNKYEPQIIIQGAINYAEQCKAKGTLKEYIKHPTTFLNAESFLNDFDTKPIQPGRGGNHGKNEDARKFAEENNIPF